MVQARKRVSYILPPPSESTPLLQLPPVGVSRLGAIGPLLVTSPTKRGQKGVSGRPQHPRHRLGIASLALDTSTQLVGHYAPEGILYSGGRDGLIMSWDLGVHLKRRRRKDSADGTRRRARWEALTGWGDSAIDEETDDDERLTSDGDVLGEVTTNIGKRKREASLAADFPYESRWEIDLSAFEAGTPTRFRQSVQAHVDWVNDILLCNRNQTVISASSDGTLKAWNPHASVLEDPSTIGSHSDYVRCLAHCREQNWIASGAFDRTVKLWDLSSNTKSPLVTLNLPDTTAPKSSIYALAVDPFGQVIASGSPERVIRLWDPRSGKRIGKLVGHTDNIRAMIISVDSKYLLTGSADASIKLWSLTSQRCLHTFAHHTESVWSLFSDHPSLEVFYSGDRSGLVCRVDVEDCSDISEGECVLLCNDLDSDKAMSEGINKMAVMDDKLLWTASGTSTLRRWNIPPRRVSRPGTYLLDSDGDRFTPHAQPSKGRSFPMSDATEANMRFAEPIHSGTLSGAPSLYSFTSEPLRDRELDSKWNYLPYDSLVRLVSANDPFPHFSARTRDPEVATLYSAASVLSIPRLNLAKSPTALVQSPPPSHVVHGSRTEDTIFPSNARAQYEEREFAADAIPVCPEPDFVISGDAGFVRCMMLNDRIHALGVDTLGGVVVWDVIRGMCLGRYLPEDIAGASQSGSSSGGSGEGERSPRESLDLVRDRIEGEALISPWCTVDTKAGVLTVHLMEKWFEAEVYADEVGFATDRQFNEDSKLNLGKWILRNLFMQFISEEVRRHRCHQGDAFPPSLSRSSSHEEFDPRTPISPSFTETFPSSSTTLICSPTMKRAIVPAAPAVVRSSPLIAPLIPLHPQANIAVMPSIPQSPPVGHHRTRSTGTADASIPPPDAKDDYASTRLRQNAAPGSPEDSRTEPATPITPSGLMGRLRNFGRTTKRPVSDTPSVPPTPTTETPALEETKDVIEVPKTPVQVLLSGPLNPATSADAPVMSKPPNATILISEEGSPGYSVVYRSLASACHDNIEALENAMPLWLAEYLLLNQSPSMPPPVKVSFVLVPWNKDHESEPLPELLNTQQSKLTANRNLRIRKILCHVQDRIERMSTSSRAGSIRSSVDELPGRNTHNPSRPQAEELYELLCNDTNLPLSMTLGAVRQYVWKSSAELVLVYRRKKKSGA